jgi:hypothetical protein
VFLNSLFGVKLPVFFFPPLRVFFFTGAVVLFPGSGSILGGSSAQLFLAIPVRLVFLMFIFPIVAIPVFYCPYVRRVGFLFSIPFYVYSSRVRVFIWCLVFPLSVDYFVPLAFVDRFDLPSFGFSWGARVAGLMLAPARRFLSAILVVGGLSSLFRPPVAVPVHSFT